MSLTVSVAADSHDLVTEALVKDELAVTGSTADARIRRIIRRVSDEIQRICGRTFARETVIESLPGTDTQSLVLERTPIISVTSVVQDGVTITAGTNPEHYSIEDAEAGILHRANGWPGHGGLLERVSQNVKAGTFDHDIVVTYQAGYVLPSFTDATGENLPGTIEDVALDMIRERYARRGSGRERQSYKIGDYSVTYSKDLVGRMRRELAPFRRVAIA